MMLINTSLLRERFIITDKNDSTVPIEAMGNRISLPLSLPGQLQPERLIVRAQSMHMALKMASFIVREFFENGSLLNRFTSTDFDVCWQNLMVPFENSYNPNAWCSIYHNGRPIFQGGRYHSFLDVIEQCDIKNRAEYDRAIQLAEDIFSQAGKDVSIEHQVNIGVVIGAMGDITRCGLVLRSPIRTTTFNFILEKKHINAMPLHAHDGLELAAYFLEGIQLSVTNGMTEYLLEKGTITPESPRAKQAKSAYNRIGTLTHSIKTYEQTHAIRYRPEKPDFIQLRNESRRAGEAMLNDSAGENNEQGDHT